MSVCLIIFGAAVRADGTPSGTLSRRISGALGAAHQLDNVMFLATGGAGENGIVEADVMGSILAAAGVPCSSIILDRAATDTFESILHCDQLLRSIGNVEWVSPCTSRYHIPRCRLLLRLLGWRVHETQMPSDWQFVPKAKLIRYYLKELISTPYDVLLLSLYLIRTRAGQKPS
jgi:vancomycin permeability regulator SanA